MEKKRLIHMNGEPNALKGARSVRRGVHVASSNGRPVPTLLIVATQKPDSKAVSSQIKANLTGIISFPMATLGASFSILGNGRAKELPSIPGRAIWKSGLDQFEVQTAFLSPDQTKIELDKSSPPKDETIEEKTV